MKFSSALLTATAVAGVAAIVPSEANATLLATVSYYYNYDDTVTAYLTNNSPLTETNVFLNGIGDLGPVAPGHYVAANVGDLDDYGYAPVSASFNIGVNSFGGTFPEDGNLAGDAYGSSGTLGTISGTIPEPASLALLGGSLLGLGVARRRRKA